MAQEVQEITTVEKSQPRQVVKTTTKVTPEVQVEHPQKVFEKKKAIFRTYQVIWYIFGIIEVLLGFRMTLKALGAAPASGFTSLVYALSDPLAVPFQGILRTTFAPQGSVFEWSTLIAAIVYLLIAWGLVELLQFAKPVTPQEVEQEVDN